MIIPIHEAWDRQPQCPVRIDWSNPLTRGLVFAHVANAPVELVRGGLSTTAYGTAPGDAGISIADTKIATFSRKFADFADEFTMLSVCSTPALVSSGDVRMVLNPGNSTGQGQTSYDGGTSVNSSVYYYPDYSGISTVSAGSKLVQGKTSVLITTYKRNTSHLLYLNGVQVASATPGNFAGSFSAASSTTITSGGSFSSSLRPALNAIFLRALSPQEVALLSATPWRLLAP